MGRGLLILVSGLVIIVGFIQMSVSERLKAIPQTTFDYHQETDAQNIANTLIEYGIEEIRNDQTWDEGFSSNDFMGAEATLQVFDFDDFDNNNPNIPSNHNIQNWNRWIILLVSTVETDRTKAIVEASVTQDSFSRFAFFSNDENGIYFGSGDVINGPVHTNGTLNMTDSPIFNGPVTSSNGWRGSANPQFNGITDFDAQPIAMPDNTQGNQLRNQAQNGGLSFNTDITVVFNNNGTVDISQGADPPTNYNLGNWNGVISSSGTVTVQGTVNGQATLHSSQQVRISGDITYQDQSQNSSDLLGIVSQGDIVVNSDAHRINGNQDLTINGSLMATGQGNSFRVQSFDDGNFRGTLNLLGGIQQDTRGAVAQTRWRGGLSGYNKNYSYDSRLAQQNPPFYPRASTFSVQYIEEKPVEFYK